MSYKTIRIWYWITTAIFALWIFADGIGGVMRAQAGVDSLVHLGYPIYLLTVSGVAKILGAIAIVQNKFKTVKEWAYAGYAFNCLLAAASRVYVGDGLFLILMPFIFLALMFVSYFFWKKMNAAQRTKEVPA